MKTDIQRQLCMFVATSKCYSSEQNDVIYMGRFCTSNASDISGLFVIVLCITYIIAGMWVNRITPFAVYNSSKDPLCILCLTQLKPQKACRVLSAVENKR